MGFFIAFVLIRLVSGIVHVVLEHSVKFRSSRWIAGLHAPITMPAFSRSAKFCVIPIESSRLSTAWCHLWIIPWNVQRNIPNGTYPAGMYTVSPRCWMKSSGLTRSGIVGSTCFFLKKYRSMPTANAEDPRPT